MFHDVAAANHTSFHYQQYCAYDPGPRRLPRKKVRIEGGRPVLATMGCPTKGSDSFLILPLWRAETERPFEAMVFGHPLGVSSSPVVPSFSK
jgi:hypothetical protein